MPVEDPDVGRRVRDELLAARFIQTLEQMRALQVEPQLELAREPRTADVFWRCPLLIYSATEKPGRFCAERYSWRVAFSERVIKPRSR